MRKYIPDILAVIGAATIVAGVGMIYVPAALILGGAAVMFAGYVLHRARA